MSVDSKYITEQILTAEKNLAATIRWAAMIAAHCKTEYDCDAVEICLQKSIHSYTASIIDMLTGLEGGKNVGT